MNYHLTTEHMFQATFLILTILTLNLFQLIEFST